MKKKICAAVIAAAMALCLMPVTVWAAPTISLDKSDYAAGKRIRVSTSGITEQMVSDSAFVGVFDVGSDHEGWRKYRSYAYPKAGNDVVEIRAP